MIHATNWPVQCAHPECDQHHPSGKWGTIRAGEQGWYHAKDGTAYCPAHVPAWVAGWRARKRRNL